MIKISDIIKGILDFFNLEVKKEENNSCETELKLLKEEFEKVNEEHNDCEMSLEMLSNSIKKDEDDETFEAYWNTKWVINPVIYKAREDKIKFDVRNFITPKDNILLDIIEINNLIGSTYDETAFNCMRYVQRNITYISDNNLFGFKEQWDFPAEVVYRKKADCEGGTHLMVSLMRNAGIPAYKVKAMCGNVPDGHSCCIYLRDKNDGWVDLDWCYSPFLTQIDKRPLAKELEYNGKLKWQSIWFTFNDENSWSQTTLEVQPDKIQ